MLYGIIMVAMIVAWLVVFFFTVDLAMDQEGLAYLVPCAFLVFTLGPFFGLMFEYDKDHPCVQYETRMNYNAATKTMMPMKVCVLMGEWVK